MARKRAFVETVPPPEPSSSVVKVHKAATVSHATPLNGKTMRGAVEALVNDCKSHRAKRVKTAANSGLGIDDLLADDALISVVIGFKVAPRKSRLKPRGILLKHSLHSPGDEDVCFFVKDPQRTVKDYLAEHGNGGVTKVMGVEKLRKRYNTHEGRRELLRLFDLFLVDDRVLPAMPKLLGKSFVNAKKMPLPVRMDRGVVAGIERAISSTSYCPMQGSCTTVHVGKEAFTVEQIVENIETAMAKIATLQPGGWSDIQSLHLKHGKSPALPIYIALPTVSLPFVKPSKQMAAVDETAKTVGHVVEKQGSKEADDDSMSSDEDMEEQLATEGDRAGVVPGKVVDTVDSDDGSDDGSDGEGMKGEPYVEEECIAEGKATEPEVSLSKSTRKQPSPQPRRTRSSVAAAAAAQEPKAVESAKAKAADSSASKKRKASTVAGKDDPTPKGATASPKKAKRTAATPKATPKKAAAAPKKTGATPKKAEATPKKGAAIPKKAAATPKKAADTPKKAAATPKKTAATPKKAAATPKRAVATPKKTPATPSRVPSARAAKNAASAI